MFVLIIFIDKLETWGQKLGHQAKSKEDFVNTL